MTTRRRFLQSAAAAALACPALRAIEPIPRRGAPLLKLSLAAYSFNRFLSLKGKTPPSMTLDEFAVFAAAHQVPAIEPTSYYFPDTSAAAMARYRGMCTRLGLDISGTAVGNDFCKKDPKQLKAQIDDVKAWIDRAAILGAKTIRIFAGTVPAGEKEDDARVRCVEAIQTVCDHAGKYGIYLALENHGGITKTPAQLLAIVKAVKHDWFGVNLDTGNFHSRDPYRDLAEAAPYAVTVQVKTEMHPEGEQKQPADLKRLFEILRGVKYRGYVALEYEAAEDPRVAVPKALAEMARLMI